MKKKIMFAITAVLAVAILVCFVGPTVAWLTAGTDPVTNTFTPSTIKVKLEESEDLNFKMVPGWTIAKDPKAWVDADSEDCYLFVEVTESDNLDDYIAYLIGGQWKHLSTDGEDAVEFENIYYIKFDSNDEIETDVKGEKYPLLVGGSLTFDDVVYTWDDDQVLVKPTVTETMMEAISGNNSANQPTLTFKAYAVQLNMSNNAEFTPAEAWAQVKPAE